MAGISIFTAPTVEPVSLGEVKSHLRIDIDDDDILLQAAIASASEVAREYFRRENTRSTWLQTFDRWENDLVLRKKPLSAVEAITYIDPDGVTQTLSTSVYEVVTNRLPGMVRRKFGQSWPAVRAHPDVITVRYVAGYTVVPELQKAFIKCVVGVFYEFRELEITGTISKRIESLKDAFVTQRVLEAV
jgi:uncharacterized phiE125 gp8 family phage protein